MPRLEQANLRGERKEPHPKESFGSSRVKKLHAVDSLREIEVALIHWAMRDYFIARGIHDHLNKAFFYDG